MDACLLASFLLFEFKYARCLMMFWCVFFTKVLILCFKMLRLVIFMRDCLHIASLTPIVMVMRGFMFHSLFCMVLIGGSYLLCLWSKAWSGNLS